MPSQLLLNGIIAGSAYALLALGFGLIYSVTRFFHFAHGAVYTATAYFAFVFAVWLRVPLFSSLILSVLLAALLGCSIELLVYGPLRKVGATSTVLLVASLGLFTLIQNVISLVFGDATKSIRTGIVSEGLPILGGRITPIQIVTIGVSIALCCLSWVALRFTRVGRIVRAVASDSELSGAVGIDSGTVALLVFAVGSALAAVASVLFALDTDMTPTIGFNALLMGVVAVIIGGVGSVPGALLGGLFVGIARNLVVWRLPTQWQDGILFLILILFLLLRPQGFLGRPLRKAMV